MSGVFRYSMLIQWSDEDGVYVVRLPELGKHVLGNPVTYGDTYEAARKGQEALEALVRSLEQDGPPLSKPDIYSTGEKVGVR